LVNGKLRYNITRIILQLELDLEFRLSNPRNKGFCIEVTLQI